MVSSWFRMALTSFNIAQLEGSVNRCFNDKEVVLLGKYQDSDEEHELKIILNFVDINIGDKTRETLSTYINSYLIFADAKNISDAHYTDELVDSVKQFKNYNKVVYVGFYNYTAPENIDVKNEYTEIEKLEEKIRGFNVGIVKEEKIEQVITQTIPKAIRSILLDRNPNYDEDYRNTKTYEINYYDDYIGIIKPSEYINHLKPGIQYKPVTTTRKIQERDLFNFM